MQPSATPLPIGGAVIPGTLRANMEDVRAQGRNYSLKQAVGVVVPLAVQVAELHQAGRTLFVHPSAIKADAAGHYHVDPALSQQAPTLPRDRACMAPEERNGRPGNARASVYALAAMFYELVTGQTVGPGMQRPTGVLPHAPKDLDLILSKALVADPGHRPDDIGALAQALHHLAPAGSIPPPDADESHLDQDENFAVDVSLSMLPPEPSSPSAANAFGLGVQNAVKAAVDSAGELHALKARLEADKRPRYVVIKDGMDHGPFGAVELLQQIANHTFVETDTLRDAFSNDERPIRDWQEFAPFAEHARLHREHKAEKAAIERVVVQEKKQTRGKAFIGIAVLGVALVVGAVWVIRARGAKSDDIAVQTDQVTSIETDGGLKAAKRTGGGRGGIVGKSASGHPIIGGGSTCEAAQAAYVEEYKIGGPSIAPDLTAGAYGSVLNRGSYFAHCGVPDNVSLNICAAVQNGRAVGVTISTKPNSPGINSCVAGAVRGLSFPSHPRLDVTRTGFAAQ